MLETFSVSGTRRCVAHGQLVKFPHAKRTVRKRPPYQSFPSGQAHVWAQEFDPDENCNDGVVGSDPFKVAEGKRYISEGKFRSNGVARGFNSTGSTFREHG
jgi:hypothetical protein